MVIIMVKTIGPKLEIVLNMKNCPHAELTDRITQSVKNSGYWNRKFVILLYTCNYLIIK